MRIIAGRWKGRVLPGKAGPGVRPATDKVRGALFNILQNRLDLAGAQVLDLFAGTGSLGFEALSRGAAGVTFVESDRAALRAIRENADRLGCSDECDFAQEDAARFLAHPGGPYALVFADPPYDYARLAGLPALALGSGALAPEGYLIVEHRRGTVFESLPPGCGAFTRPFGGTEVTFFHRTESGIGTTTTTGNDA